MTANDLLTRKDFEQFSAELLSELRRLGLGNLGMKRKETEKEWLKSHEVRKLLGVSAGTLQNLRVNGTLAFTRIGGLMWYRYDDIRKLLETNYQKSNG